jgi:hydrogenase nickel incorporation protein HypA/HybF
MHELSIAQSILDLATEEAKLRGAVQIHSIHLRLGPMSGVAKDALVSAFDLAREFYPCAGAQLQIEETPLTGLCPTCERAKELVSMQELRCADCGTLIHELESGNELEVVALELQ